MSHARIPFFVSAREAKLVLTEKSQVIRLSRFATLQGRKGRWGGGYKKLAESQPSEEREQEICHSGVDTESHENVIHFGAAGGTEGARCTPIASCCLSWFGRFTSQTFPLSLSASLPCLWVASCLEKITLKNCTELKLELRVTLWKINIGSETSSGI